MMDGFDSMGNVLLRLQSFLADRYANTIGELLVFCLLLAALFLYLHARRHRQGRMDRSSIPLVIGGWGSRGKSGTERLKAALFNAMGRSLICKTTGCEPVLLYGKRFGPLEEIPLHRPYDKATIWEQLDVLHIAAQAKVDVFLWECMGLNPDYVKLMQEDWMRDDISTITNTYPDHEDIQGPSGMDVAESIASFIPPGGQLLTSEQLMYPLLEKRCTEQGAAIGKPSPFDLYCITDEVLQRFPYNEHPHNIALILALARKLGVSQDYALKEMADRIKPDIGVLRVYPRVEIKGCTLEFSNGFSANEKFGCLSNWQRLGLNKLNIIDAPKVWLTALVNNREDRVTRSQVFAQLLVQEVDIDCIYVVGSNIDGFESFYVETVHALVKELDLSHRESARLVLMEYGQRLRIPESRAVLERRVAGLPGDNEISANFLAWQALKEELDRGPYNSALMEKIRNFLIQCFRKKLIKVPPHTDARTLFKLIVASTPLGFEHKMHGMQNIKGIGLLWLELWEQLAMLEKRNRISACSASELKEFARNMKLMENPLCLAFLNEDGAESHEADEGIPAPILVEPRTKSSLPRLPSYARHGIMNMARPNTEARRSRRIKAVYRNLASGRFSAAEATAEIRKAQGVSG
jgi:poly-gamma-glutamate synthase PgsB/CapB